MGQSDRDKIPQHIGRYEIQAAIGAGSMGAVYKGFDPLIKRTLAIKTIRLDIPRGSEEYDTFLERFYQEARISGTLSHPNIVTLYDIGEESGVPFLAMEYIDGETVESRIQRGERFPAAQVVSLVRQLASALDYAHSRSVVHRDVKPANMLLFEGQRIKITDFGIAKLADANLTRVGQILGTPSYMSPEQATGQALDGRTDIFSLGVCAFEMLAGVQPFPGDTVTSIVYKIVNADPIEPADLEARGLLTPRWRATFARVLAKQREARYQTGAEFAADLESCVARGGNATMVPAPAPPAVRTLPPTARKASDTTPTPKSSPIPSGLGDVNADEPTVLMTAEEATGLEPTAEVPRAQPPGSRTAEIPAETITTARVERPDVDEEPPTVAISAEQLAPDVVSPDVPTVLMGPSEFGEFGEFEGGNEEATVVIASDELDMAPTRPEGVEAVPQRLVPAPAPPPVATRAPRARPPAAPTPQPPPGRIAAPPPAAPAPQPLKLLLLLGVPMLILLVIAGVLAFRFFANRSPALGSLSVETRPAGAAISIDGEPMGLAPAELQELAAGTREVRLSLTGYREEVRTVEIPSGASASLSLDLQPLGEAPTTGTVDFSSQPPGATIGVDGEERGVTPLEGVVLEPGEHEVTLELGGYQSWSGQVVVESGGVARVEAELERVRPRTRTTPQPTPQPTAEPTPEPTPIDRPTPEPTPAKPDPNRVYSGDEVDKAPVKKRENPVDRNAIPRLERGQSVSVTVAYVVDEFGRVIDVKIIESGTPELDAAMTEAIRGWEYEPARLDGQPVKYRYVRKFTYRAG